MNEFSDDPFSRRLATLEPRVDPTAIARHALAAAERRRPRLPYAAGVVAVVAVAFVVLTTTSVAQNWFSEVYRTGDVFAAGSRSVSLSEARTTGLPVPATSELPGGWKLHDKGAVYLTRTQLLTLVELQYDRDGYRGMNVRLWSGVSIGGAETRVHDETLVVSGRTVYVRRDYGEVSAFFNVGEALVEIWAFGPALAGRPLTSGTIAELAEALMQ